MLSEWAQYVLKQNRIPEEDVADVSNEMLVTFKDGTQRRICEVYSRVMGYIRPSTEFNIGKYSEFESRKEYTEEKIMPHLVEVPDDIA